MNKDLILNSLYIKGFRGLRELKIESLGRVNLITGKNNTGKSSILEAISLYASEFDQRLIANLQIERGEKRNARVRGSDQADSSLKMLSSLFSGRQIEFNSQHPIIIGELEENLFGTSAKEHSSIKARLVQFFTETVSDSEGGVLRRKIFTNDPSDESRIGLEITSGEKSRTIPIEGDRPFDRFLGRGEQSPRYSFNYVKSNIDLDMRSNSFLWDSISLSEKEDFVIEGLKIIENSIERLAFVEDSNSRYRTPLVKLSSSSEIIPLQSMGDGINRILSIVLCQVNADNGFLLVDEFENGLHYSVQDQLWEMVFQLAVDLNVQVFATTHSNDCIQSFERVLNSGKAGFDGKLIRLENQNGDIKEVPFSAEELKIASEQNIEVR